MTENQRPSLTLATPTDILDAIPVLLGSTPTEGVVMIGATKANKITLARTVDLATAASPRFLTTAKRLFQRHKATTGFIVASSDDIDAARIAAEAAAVASIVEAHVDVRAVIWTDGLVWHERLTKAEGRRA